MKIAIRENKIWYNIYDEYNHFSCMVSKGSMDKFIKLLQHFLNDKIDWTSYRFFGVGYPLTVHLNPLLREYDIKGRANSINYTRLATILIEIGLYKNKIKNKDDIATTLGKKCWCKSTEKALKTLELPLVARLYKIIKKGETL